jgi:hypothetical protein
VLLLLRNLQQGHDRQRAGLMHELPRRLLRRVVRAALLLLAHSLLGQHHLRHLCARVGVCVRAVLRNVLLHGLCPACQDGGAEPAQTGNWPLSAPVKC